MFPVPGNGNLYELSIHFVSGKDLPNYDLVGKSDPYLLVNFNGRSQFKGKVINDNLNPVWNEHINVANIAEGTNINIQVYDKDYLTDDDLLGQYVYPFAPEGLQPDGHWVWEKHFNLSKKHHRNRGSIYVKFECWRSQQPGAMKLVGPVRWRRHTCSVTGFCNTKLSTTKVSSNKFSGTIRGLTGLLNAGTFANHYTYKLFLLNIAETFNYQKQPWNKNYPAAQKIFDTKFLGYKVGQTTINAQHQAMYNVDGNTLHNECHSADDFFRMIDYGKSNGERRYYTYVIMDDSMRFSETGAAFFQDFTSKHAMHSSASEEVYYAGEFTIADSETRPGGYKLVIDNNSGTYAPPKDKLPLLQRLFEDNFSGMEVETLDFKQDEQRLKYYQDMCPSRSLQSLQA